MNIHAPTVPSGPTSGPATNGNTAQLSFRELQLKKENLEAELKALSGVLDSVSGGPAAVDAQSWLTQVAAWGGHEHQSVDARWLSSRGH